MEVSEFDKIVESYAKEIYRYLEKNNKSTPLNMKQDILISNSLLYLSLGWLLKEGKVAIDRLDNNYSIALR